MQLLTIHDVVKLLKIERHTIYRLVKISKFPQPIIIHDKGKRYRWDESDIINWINHIKKESFK
jgi:predicted DNA-binding transcriptional regulator AlpA